MYLSPAIDNADALNREAGHAQGKKVVDVELTRRELEVLQLIADGNSTKDIAATLEVSVKTIETHRKQIMDKLDIRTIAGLTKYCLREGLTSL
jgi:DNA-binding NarL/FixJ family response regulator